ncbi:MAG TPA: acyl-CoA dehydrogenase family protein [Gemmatales bacterium]|nr:acyl-CoA dehydrogenase family protein [Gemmatales bacterium]
MALTAEQRDKQFKDAEELLFKDASKLGFVKALYFGFFNSELAFPYPELPAEQQREAKEAAEAVARFCAEKVDAAQIDKDCGFPVAVVRGMADLGVLGMTVPKEYGGRGFNQQQYCRILEEIGAADQGLGIFVNAHHSIGLRAFLLEGTEEQKKRFLPALVNGEHIGAFALTEPEAGSDAAGVQTTATLSEDGTHYLLNGRKRYITNAALSDVMTLMAKATVPGKEKPEITAFILETKKAEGIEWIHKNQPKCGIRGTWQGEFILRNVRVPKENVLGKLGRGLKLALSVLNFGRTTFGATCAGAAKVCVAAAARPANTRRQFEQRLGDFEMVKKKLAHMAADSFAMESTTYHCASLVDRGFGDYMLETAILKVFASDALWRIVNDCIQIYGGSAYFSDLPYERIMRDARINLIGEGANDVMRSFIAMYGMGNVGKVVDDALKAPLTGLGALFKFAGSRVAARFKTPDVPVKHPSLREAANQLGQRVKEFGTAVETVLRKHQKMILERQYVQERIADAAIELYTSTCVLTRLDLMLSRPGVNEHDVIAGKFYLKAASRRIKSRLEELWSNDDADTTIAADSLLGLHRASNGTS